MAARPSEQRRDHGDRVVERGEDEENDELENYEEDEQKREHDEQLEHEDDGQLEHEDDGQVEHEEDEQLEDVELKPDLLPSQVVRDCSCDVLTPATFTVRERRWG